MDIEANPVTGAVEEPLHPPAEHTGGEPILLQYSIHLGVYNPSVGSVFDQLHPAFLGAEDRPVHGSKLRRCLPLHDGPAHVGKVTATFRSRKDVDDNRLVCPDWPISMMVGINPLQAGRHNRMLGHALVFHQLQMYDLLEQLSGQLLAVEVQEPVALHLGCPNRRDRRAHGFFGGPLGRGNRLDLCFALHQPCLEERLTLYGERVTPCPQAIGILDAEVAWDQQMASASLLQHEV